MKKNLLQFSFLLGLLFQSFDNNAQSEIGHTTITFTDATRNDRAIGTEIYYPSVEAGDEVAIDGINHPVIVFGHGFVMGYTAYQNIWEALVPEGYVMAFVTTEGGIAPDHQDFALDLSFVLDGMIAENLDTESIFFNALNDQQALMGHSMGGGCSWLAAAMNSNVDAVVGLAPAETNPSAIDAAGSVFCSTIIFSGTADAVTPPDDHHIPIYVNTGFWCNMFITLQEGSHCGFANAGSLCDFGELGFNGMTRETQQAHTAAILEMWLPQALMNEQFFNEEITAYDIAEADVELAFECITSTDDNDVQEDVRIWPQPCDLYLNIPVQAIASIYTLRIWDVHGKLISEVQLRSNQSVLQIETSALVSGIYIAECSSEVETLRTRFSVGH